ncbi:uncharacterized protein LOC141610732 [Silene latifolia]|uniref:uncharacterized protein LOC141610732 n=1 Tax=Silene latifolia TaxID=37657 RepID=UPI003D76CD75
MATSTTMEKSEEELRKELDALLRQQREITERIRDPRGIRRGGGGGGGFNGVAPRNLHRGFVRPADRMNGKDEPPPKRRLSSAVVKVDEEGEEAAGEQDSITELPKEAIVSSNATSLPATMQNRSSFAADSGHRSHNEFDYQAKEVPRVFPKNDDPTLVNRNKRMLGRLLGTLEKFKKEDTQLSGSEAFMRRSLSLQRAEQKAREESERLRQQERERTAENKKRDLVLRARIAAKAEEKKLELLFLQWSEHHKKLTNFIRTKTEPHIYYLPVKPLEENAELKEQKKEQAFLEWKAARREELSSYQKEIHDQYVANAERDVDRWSNARNARKGNNDTSLQETMDQELETHRLEHGPKARNIPGTNNEDEEVEDINVGEDDMMDDVLGLEEIPDSERVDNEATKPEE